MAAEGSWPESADSGKAPKGQEISRRCTCPNDNANWIASAKSAHHAPNRILVRTKRMQSAIRPKEFIDFKQLMWRHEINHVNALALRLNSS